MDEAKKLEETVGLNQRALSRRSIASDRPGGSKYEIPRASMDRACALAFWRVAVARRTTQASRRLQMATATKSLARARD